MHRNETNGNQFAFPKPHGPGFSLIELLVVIAIIGLLASLLLTSLANSKMQAQQTACLNNVKQLTLISTMYMSDTGQGLPANIPTFTGYDANAPSVWWDVVSNYETMSNLLICPSTINLPALTPNQDFPGTANYSWLGYSTSAKGGLGGSIVCSYGFNGFLYQIITLSAMGTPAAKLPLFFPKPASVQKPSQTPVFFDEIVMDTCPMETDLAATNLYTGEVPSWPIEEARGMACCTILRHGGPTASRNVPYKSGNPIPGAINMGFDDGHGELAKLQNLWTYTWHLNWNPAKVKGP